MMMLTIPALEAQERSYARSMVISDRGIVATSQTLASQAGAQVLARGGSAIDAAIAANIVLGVVEPMSCGIGGDLFAIYWDAKTAQLTGINASGWSPKGLTPDVLGSSVSVMPTHGIHSATVPGAVNGWAMLHRRFGKLPWKDLFEPAIYFAERGFPVTELIAASWHGTLNEAARKIYLQNGKAPKTGEVFRNPRLAAALRLIANDGEAAFYRGPIAKAILAASNELGGTMKAGDLSEFGSEWVTPISTEYRGWKVYELPPNGQGIAALQMLNILSTFNLPSMRSRGVDELHLQIEAQKLAYADLHRYVADPKFNKVPVDGLLSMDYARERAKLINPVRAACAVPPGKPLAAGNDTIYLSAVDRDGNIVSLIQSVFSNFGSGVGVADYGFVLHNRGALFVLDPKHPNVLAPRKRPFHTIIPAFMEKDGVHVGFGIMGGLNQSQAHAQFVSNVVDHGMNIQAALEAPRFTKLTLGGCDLNIEGRVSAATRQALTARGHKLHVLGDYAMTVGGGQAVIHDAKSGVNYGASSPRKDGAAVPEPHPYFSSQTADR
jgi:gamma-glutamyltranspeptidase/glutathione hydrolase